MSPEAWQNLCVILKEAGLDCETEPEESVDLHHHLAHINGIPADEALEWLARKFGVLPLNPVRTTSSTRAENAFRRLAPRMDSRDEEYWIPFGTLGPLLLCAHYNPASTALWEMPVELTIPLLIPQSKYAILQRDYMGRLELQPLEEGKS